MSIDELRQEAANMGLWQKHRFTVMIAGALAVSIVLVWVGLLLYRQSGAEQVDLSRPGFQSIRKAASTQSSDDYFSPNGTLDDKAFDAFGKGYDNHAIRVIGVDSFGPKPLSEESLRVVTPVDQPVVPPNPAQAAQ